MSFSSWLIVLIDKVLQKKTLYQFVLFDKEKKTRDETLNMRYKELAVVIEPNEIRFAHVLQNNLYRQIIHVKNVGNKSKRIQIFRPAIKVTFAKDRIQM